LNRFPSSKFIDLIQRSIVDTSPVGLIGGPPCQGVSQGNQASTPNDPRNSLMGTFMRLVNETESVFELDFFVFENVPGLLQEKNSARLAALKAGLSKKFHIALQKVNAQDFGVPQSRNRVLIVGLSKRKYRLTDVPLLTESIEVPRTVRQAIGNLPEATLFSRLLKVDQIPFHQNHWTMQPKSSKFTIPFYTAKGRSFRRLSWDEPSRTVAYGNREIHVHPNGHRRVSVLEAMLFQGFDLTYRLTGTLSSQFQQISNAVPPPLAKAIAAKLFQIVQRR
jgi:DNA (cytosine-5)-methyltransferase 1